MKISNTIIIVGALMFLLLVIFGGNWFFSEEPAAEVAVAETTLSNDGQASLNVTSDSGVQIQQLSPWQVIEFDDLKQTYVGGYEITGPATAFEEPVDFEMGLSAVTNGVPTLYREVSGIALPVEDVTYVMVNGVVERIRTSVDAPGKVYLLQQNVFYGEPSFLSVQFDTIDETLFGESFKSALEVRYRDDIAIYGVVSGKEYAHLIEPDSVRVEVDARARSTDDEEIELRANSIVEQDAFESTSAEIPVDTTLKCTTKGFVPVTLIARVSFQADEYVRRVDDWVKHYYSPSEWSLVENSTDDHTFTFINQQTPRCI